MLLTLLVNFLNTFFFCVDNFQNNNWPKQPTIYERPILTLEVEKYTIQQKYSVPIYPASGQGERPLSGRGWGLFRRLYLEHLWGWWAVPHVEHGGWRGSPPWVVLIPTTVPYVTNLRRESVRSDPDMTLNSPVKERKEKSVRHSCFQEKAFHYYLVFYLHLEGNKKQEKHFISLSINRARESGKRFTRSRLIPTLYQHCPARSFLQLNKFIVTPAFPSFRTLSNCH